MTQASESKRRLCYRREDRDRDYAGLGIAERSEGARQGTLVFYEQEQWETCAYRLLPTPAERGEVQRILAEGRGQEDWEELIDLAELRRKETCPEPQQVLPCMPSVAAASEQHLSVGCCLTA